MRLLKIYRVANRYRLGDLFGHFHQARLLSLVLSMPLPPADNLSSLNRGQRLRLVLEELGPIFIKFGQLLSTRRDMVPEDIADELASLQDNVPPFGEEAARTLIENALGDSIDNLFATFSMTPLASASVAQVHTATLPGGEEVVVKVVRPGIEKIIAQDIALLKGVAEFVEHNIDLGKRLRAVEVVQDYEYIIHDELNLMSEGANATQLARNFENSELLYVPKVYWDYTRNNVLVMERIYGIPVSRVAELQAAGIDLKILAERGVEIFFTQVFHHSFFHADMHPGNMMIAEDGTMQPLDFGIMGRIDRRTRYYLAEMLIGFLNGDYDRVARVHFQAGYVPSGQSEEAFAQAARSIAEPIFGLSLKDISLARLLAQLFDVTERFDMQTQPQLLLLQKTMLVAEGVGRRLHPETNMWELARPLIEQWVEDHMTPEARAAEIAAEAGRVIERLPALISDMEESIGSLGRDGLKLHPDSVAALLAREKSGSRWPLWAAAGAIAVFLLVF